MESAKRRKQIDSVFMQITGSKIRFLNFISMLIVEFSHLIKNKEYKVSLMWCKSDLENLIAKGKLNKMLVVWMF